MQSPGGDPERRGGSLGALEFISADFQLHLNRTVTWWLKKRCCSTVVRGLSRQAPVTNNDYPPLGSIPLTISFGNLRFYKLTQSNRMPQPIIAPPTHCSQPADSWYATHLKLDSLLKKRKSGRSNQDRGLQEMISRQNTQAIYAHAQSAKNILGYIRLQLTSLECSDDNAGYISMNLESLEREANLIFRICEDYQDIQDLRDLERTHGKMADQKIATMMSGRPTSPPPSFPQPQQPKDGAAEPEDSASEQEQGGSDAISGGKQIELENKLTNTL